MNNPGASPTKSVEGDNPVLDELYDTLGSVYTGLDVRRKETEDDQRKLQDEERDLIEQREKAAQDGDQDRYRDLTEQLERLAEAHMVSQSATEETDDAEGQHADAEGRLDSERGTDGDEHADPSGGPTVPSRGDRGEL